MSAWLARFRELHPRAEIAGIAEIACSPDAPGNFGNNGNFGTGVATEEDRAYAADALRRAANALSREALGDEAELTVRGEVT